MASYEVHSRVIDDTRPPGILSLCNTLAPKDISPEVSERLAARILATIAHDTGAHDAA